MIESIDLMIWGREFTLPIDYNCYDGETETDEQFKALERLLNHKDWIDEAKSRVEAYCKDDVMDDEENNKKDNIFSYIKPECIFIKHEDFNPRIAIMCKYRYDLEHGLSIVFSTDGQITVDIQDIIL